MLTEYNGNSPAGGPNLEELYRSIFITFARKGTASDLNSIEFVSYTCDDEIKEIPLFTEKSFVFKEYPEDALLVEAGGPLFWSNLFSLTETDKCVVSINPDQPNSVRITRNMILQMMGKAEIPSATK